MAIWQYHFFLIPGKEAIDLKSATEGDDFDDSIFWEGKNCSVEFFAPLTDLLPRNKSWSNEIELFGKEDETCVELFIERGKVVSSTCRIDFRFDFEFFLSKLTEFCLENDIVLIDEGINLLPLDIPIIVLTIENSPQYKKYVKLSDDTT